MRRAKTVGILLVASILALMNAMRSAAAHAQSSERGAAFGMLGMVSSAHPLATAAGLEILAAGGTAFDAAVAIAAALNVVEPMMSGLGGYGTILIYDARAREPRFINSSGRIPRATDPDAFRAPAPNFLANRRGAKAVSTPGNANAWEAMWRGYGTLDWPRLFEPAIRVAENGFPISDRTAGMIRSAFGEFPEHARAFYGRDGRPLATGDTLVQKDLARSFRLIAEHGAKAVHGGEIGRAIDAEMREVGGFLSLDDLVENQAEWWHPIRIEYRGYEVVTAAPPANAFDALVRIGMMSRFDARALGHNSVGYLHRFAEITKHGFWVRLCWAGDPDIATPPLERLLSPDYWAEQVARIDLEKASRFEPAAAFGPQTHTTHFVVADTAGNIVSATQTLGNVFGSRIMAKGTGIWLNNSLAYSTFEPKGNPMDAHAGRRKLSGDVPVIILREGRPWAAIGTPGGHTIGQTVPQIVFNLIDFGMDIQSAIDAPRVSFVEPNQLHVEREIAETARQSLAAMGHDVRVVSAIGNAHGLVLELGADGSIRFFGGADRRGEGLAHGLDPRH